MGNLKERFYLLENLNFYDGIFMDKNILRDYCFMKVYLKILLIDFILFDL